MFRTVIGNLRTALVESSWIQNDTNVAQRACPILGSWDELTEHYRTLLSQAFEARTRNQEVEALRQQVAALITERDGLRTAGGRVEAERDRAIAERDAARTELTAVTAARDAAQGVITQLLGRLDGYASQIRDSLREAAVRLRNVEQETSSNAIHALFQNAPSDSMQG